MPVKLTPLVELSARIGRDLDLVQAGGGKHLRQRCGHALG